MVACSGQSCEVFAIFWQLFGSCICHTHGFWGWVQVLKAEDSEGAKGVLCRAGEGQKRRITTNCCLGLSIAVTTCKESLAEVPTSPPVKIVFY